MTTLYSVHRPTPGYAREDEGGSEVVGVYTDREVARRVAILCHGRWDEVTLDYVWPGIKARAGEFGFEL